MIKKKWYTVFSPKLFGKKEVGEVMAQEAKELMNRRIEAGLNEVSGEFSKFYIKLIFRVNEVKDDNAYTRFDGHRCLREYISHIVRPRISRVDNNIVISTKDGMKIRVKCLLIFSKRVRKPLKTQAVLLMDQIVSEYASKHDSDSFIKAMVSGELAKDIKSRCKTIYPVSKVEVRKSEVLAPLEK